MNRLNFNLKPDGGSFRPGGKTTKWIIVVALAIIAIWAIASWLGYKNEANHPGYEYARAEGDSINVAIAYSPMSMYRYGDTLGGLNYEIMRGIAHMEGDKVKFYPVVSVSEALEKLRAGVYDVVMADIPTFASHRKLYRFTEPVYTDRQVLVSRDTTVTSTLALAGKPVWVVEGSPAVERLENLAREIGDTIPLHISNDYSAEQLVIMTARGTIPRCVVNELVAQSLQAEYPEAKISTKVSFNQFQSWILNKNDSVLADTLDAQITRFKLTPEYAALIAKWTGEVATYVPADSATVAPPELE